MFLFFEHTGLTDDLKLWDLYMKAKAAFWTAAEIDLSKDLSDRNHCLTDNEQHIVSTILAFFTSSDAIVNENLVTRFCKEVQIPEARYFYTFQAMMENIHSEVYGLLIDTYIRKPTQRDTLFRAIDEHPTVKAKAVWALRWIKDSSSFATHLVPFAAVEGIFFSGSFTIIFWLKKWGLMPGLSFSNELIARDEGMHTLFAMTLYHTLKQPLPADTILDIVRNAVDIEKAFWDGECHYYDLATLTLHSKVHSSLCAWDWMQTV